MEIKDTWKNHPLYKQGVVELVPTDWVYKYRGNVSPKTNLNDGTVVNIDELWEQILNKGLEDPLIMRIGIKNKKFRLEAGNHRVQVLYKNHVQMIPVTVEIKEECGPHAENVMNDASHNFEIGDELLIQKITKEYMKPSEVFKSLKNLNEANRL